MSLTGVNNNSYNNSPFSPVTQQSTFRPYISSVNSVIEQDYEGRSSYSNDESTLEDNIGGVGYERGTDSEEENDSYPNANTFTTTEDEEDDDEMECSESDSEVAEDDQNNSSIQNHPFENGNNFNNIHRNSGGITNGNIINVSNPNNANSNSNNNNVLPPIQLHPPHSMSTSTLNISTTQPPNRSIESDHPFGARYPTLNLMNTRNIPPNHPPPPPPYYNINPYVEGYSQRQAMFRSLHGSHPPSSYSSGTESISQPPMPSPSVTVTMPSQPKQNSLRFGFPDHQESRDREVDGEDEDDGSSTNSYDATSSRKRARSISNEWAIPPQPQIQFGSIDPVNRSRQVTNHSHNHNHNHNLRTSSSPLPTPNRPPIETRIPTDYTQEITNISATPISQPSNFYYPTMRNYAYQQSSSTTASPPPIQMHQQPHFFNRRTSHSNQRRIYSLPLDSSSIRRPTLDERDNGYSNNFASSSSDISNVTYPDVSSTPQERRNQHAHNNNVNNTNVSQVQRVPWGPRNDVQRGGRTESLVRPITPDPGPRRHASRPTVYPPTNNSPFGGSLESARVNGNNEEPDTSVEISGNSGGDANIGNTNVPHNLWTNPTRRSDTTTRHRTVVPTLSVATHISRGSSTDNHLSNEQLARRIQAREYGEEHSTIARLLAGNRARSTSRRDTGSNTSNSSRSGSIRRDTSSRGPIHRLPEILPHHDRHHSEERGNETRSRTHNSRSGQRSGRQSGHFLQHHLIQSYPLLGNFIDSSDIEIEEFWDLLPDILGGSGIAANPDNYLDEDEFDTSYEGLIQLSERIGDAKPKGVPEHIINSLPTKLYSLGKGKSPEERCTICLTEYENNERLRDLPCTHDFHQECIDSWFKNSDKCPICRRSVTEN